MPVDRYTGEFVYLNEYEVKDFYIRFPHYEKNQLFMPVIRYVLDGREVYQRMYMSLYDWQRLFEAASFHYAMKHFASLRLGCAVWLSLTRHQTVVC